MSRLPSFSVALRATEAAATPGPWFVATNVLTGEPRIRRLNDNRPIVRPTENETAAARDYGDGDLTDTYRLIVLLRNAAPEIVAVLEAVQRALAHQDGSPDMAAAGYADIIAALDALNAKVEVPNV